MHRPSPILIVDSDRAQSLVRLPVFPGRAFVALSRTESGGEVVALGTALPWSWIRADEQNERLLRNLLTRPTNAARRSRK